MVRHLPEALWCSAKHYAVKQRDEPVGPVPESRFDEILSEYDDDAVFVHAGLSDVKSAFDTDPYEFLMDELEANFESILTPGFTSSFRDTGYYHKTESEPEVGAFSNLFFEDADYRTDDPIHSILVSGEYEERLADCNHRDTFGPDGCYAQLDEDDVRILNVGTPWLVSTQLHYVERTLDVPYVESTEYEGTIHYEDGDREYVEQTNYHKTLPYLYVYFWDRLGIRRQLMADGVLDYYDLNGLTVMSVTAGDLLTALEPRVEEDPYYLVR